jgi:tetratricopeptide (TPR) repeat protein
VAIAQDEAALIDRAYQLYDQGNFEEAEFTALRALMSKSELDNVDRARLYRILGFTYVVLGENEKAQRQFISWLEIDPLAKLDPLYISPKIINVFNEAKEAYEEMKAQAEPVGIEDLQSQVNAFQRSMLYPGLGQISRGQNFKGYSLVALETIFLGAFVYCQLNYDSAKDDYLNETDTAKMQSLYDDYNLFYKGRYTSLILAGAVYLYSLFDVVYFPPESTTESNFISLSVSPLQSHLLTLSISF